MSSKTDISWAAGFFEGEGCISIVSRRDGHKMRRGVSLSLVNTDRDVLERFVSIMGAGKVSELKSERPAHYKTQYRWQVANARQVERMLALLMPYLGERRMRKALEALGVAETIADTRGPSKSALCNKGHILAGLNAKTSNGRRRCRTCLNAWRRENEVPGRAERMRAKSCG